MENDKIDPRIYDLYDEYCHSTMERREFLNRAAAITIIGGGSALVMAQALLPRYAEAQMISFTQGALRNL
jgi:carboxymethylenebutenolidase